MVYLWKRDGWVYNYAADSETEAKKIAKHLDGFTTAPDMAVPDDEDEFESMNGLARLIDGEIFLGKTGVETTAEANAGRVRFLKSQLAGTDYIAAKIAEGSATVEKYAEKIAQRQAWRQEIAELEATA
jgi:hypothetical protein